MRTAMNLLLTFARRHSAIVTLHPLPGKTAVTLIFDSGQTVRAEHALAYIAAMDVMRLARERLNASTK